MSRWHQKHVVFDTCVVVAGHKQPRRNAFSPSREVFRCWKLKQLRGAMSDPLLNEYQEVLQRDDSNIAQEDRAMVLSVARSPANTTHYQIPLKPPRASPDPGDDHVLALVDAAQPDYLCTKDKPGLLLLRFRGDTVMITPEDLHNLAMYDATVKAALDHDTALQLKRSVSAMSQGRTVAATPSMSFAERQGNGSQVDAK